MNVHIWCTDVYCVYQAHRASVPTQVPFQSQTISQSSKDDFFIIRFNTQPDTYDSKGLKINFWNVPDWQGNWTMDFCTSGRLPLHWCWATEIPVNLLIKASFGTSKHAQMAVMTYLNHSSNKHFWNIFTCILKFICNTKGTKKWRIQKLKTIKVKPMPLTTVVPLKCAQNVSNNNGKFIYHSNLAAIRW